MTQKSAIDLMLVSVLQSRFKSITEEMGLTLLRTTRSPILNEARDFVTGLYDYKGRMLEQTEYIPVLAFALQPVCRHIINYFGDDISPGDVIIHNDVFSGGNQNADVAIFKPIFAENRLIAWAACKGHQADIGGAVAGGYNPEAREVWQEAFRIPAVKIFEGGKLRRDVWDLIFANIRFPIVEEDIRAHIGGCNVGERAIKQLVEKYGAEKLQAHIEYLFNITEDKMRNEIKKIPDGVYHGQSYMYNDGIDQKSKHLINLTITVDGDSISFDYAGTAPQTPGFANAPLSSSISAIMLTLLMIIDPNIPHNDGLLRPIDIHIPAGCFLNAKFPAATTFGNTIAGPHSDAIFKALAPALPDRVTAGWNRALCAAMSGRSPHSGNKWADILFLALKGGSGATDGVDGYDHIGLINCAGGILAQDYEMFELHNPLFLLKHEYARDSAGAGKYRGGLGTITEFIMQGEDTTCVTFGDGVDVGGFGLFGGMDGSLNRIELNYPEGKQYTAQSKEIIKAIPTGTVFRQQAGGGGGYGEPSKRDAARVKQELKEGLISPETAKNVYRVKLDPKPGGKDK